MDALQNYDFTAPASGAEAPIGAPGRLIYYYSGSAGGADSTILVRAGNTGTRFLLKPGQSYKLPADAKEIDTWYISNYGKAAPIIGVLQIGDGDFKDNRISGSVEVIDGGKSRTNAGITFVGFVGQGAVAAQYAHVALYNPANSGKNIVLSKFRVGSASAGAYYLQQHNAALTTAKGTASSKKIGGTASTALLSSQANATVIGTNIQAENLAVNTPLTFEPKEPFIIPPGSSLLIVQNVVNTDINAIFDFYEESQ